MDSWLSHSWCARWSLLNVGHPTHLWAVVIPGMLVVRIWLPSFACRAAVFDADIVRVFTLATDAGVIDVVPVFALAACNTFDLTVR